VVRVSGMAASSVARAMIGRCPRPRMAALRILRHPVTREMLDQCLAIWFPAPFSFTGEDVLELHIHGGPAVTDAVLEALGAADNLRFAEPGEFTRRAFENGKLDLTAVEGLADLIDAETEAQRRQALVQARGGLSDLYERWRRDLIETMATIEAELDFSDEADVGHDPMPAARTRITDLHRAIKAHLHDDHGGEITREGLRVVIAGPPNAGKSSLLNALARRDVAIVSTEAGTTRDLIEVRLNLAGYPVVLIDTAGLRETSGQIEAEGIRRTFKSAADADLVLWLGDGSLDEPAVMPAPIQAHAGVLKIISKADLIIRSTGEMAISAKTGQGLPLLVEHLANEARMRLGRGDGSPRLSRPRHRRELMQASISLESFLASGSDDIELRAEDLRKAAQALGRITGRIDVDDVLDQIFAEFCIGK
jgi:tRNA modification GTPase